MSTDLLPAILKTLRDQADRGNDPLTPAQWAFLDQLARHGLQAPRAQLMLVSQLWQHLPQDCRIGDLTAEDLASAWANIGVPCPWPAPATRPAPFGVSPGAIAAALHRLDATFTLGREQGMHAEVQAYLTLRQAFLPFTECSPNPRAPAFAAVPEALVSLDEIFADTPVAPSAVHYATLRQACFDARDRTCPRAA